MKLTPREEKGVLDLSDWESGKKGEHSANAKKTNAMDKKMKKRYFESESGKEKMKWEKRNNKDWSGSNASEEKKKGVDGINNNDNNVNASRNNEREQRMEVMKNSSGRWMEAVKSKRKKEHRGYLKGVVRCNDLRTETGTQDLTRMGCKEISYLHPCPYSCPCHLPCQKPLLHHRHISCLFHREKP